MKQIAWLFDVDGVITNPESKKVEHPEILDFIAQRLSKGEFVALVTGRGLNWAVKRVAQPLINIVSDIKLLTNFYISGEFGGAYTIWENGKALHYTDPTIRVPKEIIDEAQNLTESDFSNSNFFDSQKETMVSIEMLDGMNVSNFKPIQAQLVPLLENMLKTHGEANNFEVHVDRIATNIRAKGANKYHAAEQVVKWVESKNFNPDLYLTFGDSLSDTEMAEQIYRMQLPVELIFVGGKEQLAGKIFDFPIAFTTALCDNGVLEFIQNFKDQT